MLAVLVAVGLLMIGPSPSSAQDASGTGIEIPCRRPVARVAARLLELEKLHAIQVRELAELRNEMSAAGDSAGQELYQREATVFQSLFIIEDEIRNQHDRLRSLVGTGDDFVCLVETETERKELEEKAVAVQTQLAALAAKAEQGALDVQRLQEVLQQAD